MNNVYVDRERAAHVGVRLRALDTPRLRPLQHEADDLTVP